MKKFLKFLGIAAGVFTAVMGALTVFDRLLGRKSQNEYIECGDDAPDAEDE